tara:strand:- start:2354 stop:4366 length:2013 start_codon:yes stop_codon:yes gene_type:complete
MSNRYKGGVISATPPTTTGGESGTASGAWTLEQQMQLQAAGLWPSQPLPPFIENVFSTYLYTGNGSTQTITNGVNLSGKGGLVWLKGRSIGSNNVFLDTTRGVNSSISSNNTDGAVNPAGGYVSAFNTTGFSLGSNITANGSTYTYASWTFREQPKFFDVVTYTGTGAVQNISHNLGSAPGCIIVKKFSGDGDDWGVYHRSLGATYKINLNNTDVPALSTGYWNNTEPTSSVFTVATSGITNQSGATYVAYLFAHDAGGFGLTETDNVISCGSFVQSGDTTVTLGYEPQWILIKQTNAGGDNWKIWDTMRGWSHNTYGELYPNTSAGEPSGNGNYSFPTATGFVVKSGWLTNGTYIYMAIRKGPMAVPTVGTTVFQPTVWTGTGAALQQNVNINYDSFLQFRRNGGYTTPWMDKLRGFGFTLYTQSTDSESNQTAYIAGPKINNYINFVNNIYNLSGEPWLNYAFVRAPGFFDEVCFAQTASGNQRNTHNLTVVPELIFAKARNYEDNWYVYNQTTGRNTLAYLNRTDGFGASTNAWGSSNPTATDFGTSNNVLASGYNYVAYLFATCAGVSKVGSYTGTGAAQTINCGFTAGSRFVMIKRTDSTGDWYSWDSARGIVAGNDPYLLWNTTAGEVTNTDYVDTAATGFEISSTAPAGINANGGTYIFLAIA